MLALLLNKEIGPVSGYWTSTVKEVLSKPRKFSWFGGNDETTPKLYSKRSVC